MEFKVVLRAVYGMFWRGVETDSLSLVDSLRCIARSYLEFCTWSVLSAFGKVNQLVRGIREIRRIWKTLLWVKSEVVVVITHDFYDIIYFGVFWNVDGRLLCTSTTKPWPFGADLCIIINRRRWSNGGGRRSGRLSRGGSSLLGSHISCENTGSYKVREHIVIQLWIIKRNEWHKHFVY